MESFDREKMEKIIITLHQISTIIALGEYDIFLNFFDVLLENQKSSLNKISK